MAYLLAAGIKSPFRPDLTPGDLSAIDDVEVGIRSFLARRPELRLSSGLSEKIATARRSRSSVASIVNQILMEAGTGFEQGASRDEVIFALRLLQADAIDRARLPAAWPVLSFLIETLADLDRGVVGPLFRPEKMTHRPRHSEFMQTAKAIAAAVCEALIRNGTERRKEAAERVAKILEKKLSGVLQSADVTAQTVLTWRKKGRRWTDFLNWVAVLTDPSFRGHELHIFEGRVDEWAATHHLRATAARGT